MAVRKKKTFKLEDFDSKQNIIRMLNGLDLGGKWEVVIQPATEKRSLDQSALYHLWCAQAAKYFSTEKQTYKKGDLHDIMRHKFLGYDNGKIIGNTEFAPELKSTSDLKVDEMFEYMRKMEVWCAEHGCLLKTPEDSAYNKKKVKRGGYD